MRTPLVVHNARVILADEVVEPAGVLIDGTIRAVLDSEGAWAAEIVNGAEALDADGAFVMPGVIDLHNDALEFEVNPRPGASLPLPFAFDNLERRLVAAGVTTEFHAVAFMDRPKDKRSVEIGVQRAAFIAGVSGSGPRAVDHQVLHRIDVWHPHALDAVFASLANLQVRYASLNDHTPGQGQYRDLQRFFAMREQYGDARAEAEVYQRINERAADGETIPHVHRRVAAATSELGLVLATHDDDSIAKVDGQRAIGATVNEFPVTVGVAEHARARGMSIVVGAPNIVRGGSQSGNLAASELLTRGLADVICADYHAPSILAAAFKVSHAGWASVPDAVRMVTLNAARAVQLADRGVIQPDLRADLIVVDLDDAGFPHVKTSVLDGRCVFAYQPSALAPTLVTVTSRLTATTPARRW
jgi:alpha-D-ribose 1-methylphosphonate 5-triphosphate diphosphatase